MTNEKIFQEIEELISQWIKDNFVWDKERRCYEQDGLEIPVVELKRKVRELKKKYGVEK